MWCCVTFYSALVWGVAVNLQPGSNFFFFCVCVCFSTPSQLGRLYQGKRLELQNSLHLMVQCLLFPCFDFTRTKKVIWIWWCSFYGACRTRLFLLPKQKQNCFRQVLNLRPSLKRNAGVLISVNALEKYYPKSLRFMCCFVCFFFFFAGNWGGGGGGGGMLQNVLCSLFFLHLLLDACACFSARVVFDIWSIFVFSFHLTFIALHVECFIYHIDQNTQICMCAICFCLNMFICNYR